MDLDSAMSVDNPYYPYILIYAPSLNRFIDAEWYVVHDVSILFDNWQLDRWKQNKQDAILTAKNGIDMKLYYLTWEEEEDMLEFLGWNESYGIKMDKSFYTSYH